MRNPVFQTQAAKPAIHQVRLHLIAQAAVRADRIAVTDQKHPNHQFGADRRAAHMAIVRFQFTTKPTQLENCINPTQKMVLRNHRFQVELIEKSVLPTNRCAHHRSILLLLGRTKDS